MVHIDTTCMWLNCNCTPNKMQSKLYLITPDPDDGFPEIPFFMCKPAMQTCWVSAISGHKRGQLLYPQRLQCRRYPPDSAQTVSALLSG